MTTHLTMAKEFDDLSRFVTDHRDTDQALKRLVDLAAELIPGCDGASVTQVASDQRTGRTLCTSDRTYMLHFDQIQYDERQGPCWDMAVKNDPGLVYCPDVASETRWPAFLARTMAETDIRSVLSFGLGPRLGRTALNIAGRSPHSLTDEGVAASALFALHSQVISRHITAESRVTHLETALASSRTIGSAVGMIMWIHKLPEDEAFTLLKRVSQQLNIKVRDLASHITLTGEVPQAPPRPE